MADRVALKKQPRVLQVVGSLGMGGAETMVVTAAESLADQCVMDFLVFGDTRGPLESRAEASGGEILRISSIDESGPIRFVKMLTSLLKTKKYDAVHSHINLASSWVMVAARRAGVPVRIAHSHITEDPGNSFQRKAYRSLARTLIRANSNAFAACSDEAGEHLFQSYWHTRGGTVLANGIDLDRFAAKSHGRLELREELGLQPNEIAVGMVARLAEQKNPSFMLDVIAADRSVGGNAVLFMVGTGPLRQALQDQAETLGIEEKVRFLGIRDDIPEILRALDVLAMPSLYEGLPVALIEAQAAGLPAIVSDQVDPGSDLGLGLMTFLPLGDPGVWQRELARTGDVPPPEVIRAKVRTAGYDAADSAQKMLALYTGHP